MKAALHRHRFAFTRMPVLEKTVLQALDAKEPALSHASVECYVWHSTTAACSSVGVPVCSSRQIFVRIALHPTSGETARWSEARECVVFR